MGSKQNNHSGSASTQHFEKRLASVPATQPISKMGTFSNVYVGQALAQSQLEPKSADNIIKKEIMENKLIQ
jgi:hypothetical protein